MYTYVNPMSFAARESMPVPGECVLIGKPTDWFPTYGDYLSAKDVQYRHTRWLGYALKPHLVYESFVWFVIHDDGTIAAYLKDEMIPLSALCPLANADSSRYI